MSLVNEATLAGTCDFSPSPTLTYPSPSVKARVLHVINGEDFSGAERIQDLLAQRLPDYGYEVGFVCVKPDRFDSNREAKDAPLVDVPMRHKFDLHPARQISRMVRDENYALLHSHTPRSLLIARLAARRTGTPLVHHVQCPAAADSTHTLRNRVNAWVERTCLRGVSAVLPVSQSLSEYMISQGVPREKLTVIPNAVRPFGHLPDKSPPTGVWTIGICAMFRPRKGVDVLFRALAKLRAAGLNVRLRAAGYFKEPDYEIYLKRLADELGITEIIDWRGFSDNVYDELAQMDIFTLPSLFGEGLPLAIIEAMAAGVPVVSTDVEGTPEAVRDGIDGVIVPPGDVDALAHGFERIIQGELDWRELRQSAYQRQLEQYSDTKLAHDVAAVYDSIIGSELDRTAEVPTAAPVFAESV